MAAPPTVDGFRRRPAARPAAAAMELALRWSSRPVGIALVYHRVAATRADLSPGLVPAIPAGEFEAQLRHLALRYTTVPSSELVPAVHRRQAGQRIPVAITFDDDLPSHHAVALPLLRAHGLPATFFLSGASLDAPHSFWWERLERASAADGTIEPAAIAAQLETAPAPERARLLQAIDDRAGPDPETAGIRASGVVELAENGFELGFHTRDHHRLTTLDDDALRFALREGRQRLSELAGRPLTTIAYPHGDADARVAEAASLAGFAHGFTTDGGAVRPGDDPLRLGRVDPSSVPAGQFPLWLAVRLWKGRGRR